MLTTPVIAVLIVAMVGCGSSTSTGFADARLACSGGDPHKGASIVPLLAGASGNNSDTIPFGTTLANYQRAEPYAARAAAENTRWTDMHNAIETLIAAWQALVAVTGPNQTQNGLDNLGSGDALGTTLAQEPARNVQSQWGNQAAAAEATFRSQCSIANAS
jgi:hypothetical protein